MPIAFFFAVLLEVHVVQPVVKFSARGEYSMLPMVLPGRKSRPRCTILYHRVSFRCVCLLWLPCGKSEAI